MPEREKQVLSLLFEKQLTLKEIADELGITRERARQFKEKGLRRLRAILGDELYFDKYKDRLG